jgi:siroheme synthase-like protein
VSAYPVMLEGSAIDAVVVGGGAVAVRKARALLEAGARVDVIAETISDEMHALAAEFALLALTRKAYAHHDIDRATLVVCATNDARVNAIIADEADSRGLLVNVVDDPELGNFTTPAVHRSGDIVVAVSAGGVPTAARRIRDAIAKSIDARFASAVSALAALRSSLLETERRDRWHDAAAALTGPDFAQRVQAEDFAEQVAQWR